MRTVSLTKAIEIAVVAAFCVGAVTNLATRSLVTKNGYIADGHTLAQACTIVIEVSRHIPNVKIALDAKLFD